MTIHEEPVQWRMKAGEEPTMYAWMYVCTSVWVVGGWVGGWVGECKWLHCLPIKYVCRYMYCFAIDTTRFAKVKVCRKWDKIRHR